MKRRRLSHAVALLVAVPAAAVGTASALDASVRAGLDMPEPRVRIALTVRGAPLFIASTGGGYRVLDGAGRRPILDVSDGSGRHVVAAGERRGGGGRRHAIQVGSFRDESSALAFAARLEREHAVPADVSWEAARQVYRVRLGSESRSDALAGLLATLRGSGHPDAWVVSEEIDVMPDGRLRFLDRAWEPIDAPGRGAIVVPRDGARLTVGGRAYRGLVELRVAPDGSVRAINELPLETYLRGVVPEELGPAAFPELEALKAQAVAARTYIVANLDQFAKDGYDICDTPRCQVYGGAGSEHPLSDRAVQETRGQVLVSGGRPVNAMYTSTCGGHTEDLEVVFPDMTGDHLRGVPCHAEQGEADRRGIVVRGRPVAATDDLDGATPRLLDIGRLVAADALPPEAFARSWRAAPLTESELAAALDRIAHLAGKRARPRAPAGGERAWSRLEAWRRLAGLLDDAGSGHGLVEARSLDIVLSHPDAANVPAGDRPLVASLIASGIVRPRADGRLAPGARPHRDEAIDWLAALADRFAVATLRRASVRASRGDRLEVRERRTTRTLDASASPLVFVEDAGAWRRAADVRLWPGDAIRFAEAAGRGRRLAIVAVPERASLADDRDSSRFRWSETRSRAQVERALEGVAPVGVLLDLEVLSRGVSGRVAELAVRGSKGEAVVRGFRIRRALGLPETLFDLDIQREPDGPLRRVAFHGRGWGHGVGLCQYGAYGMAKRGASYREILTHYYTGVAIRRHGGS